MTSEQQTASELVTILVSTYNGSQFLAQQLDSLYRQSYKNIRILVRDDGSSDSTRDILERACRQGKIDILEGNINLGPAASFFELLRQAALTNTAYVAFCDQDDVWAAEKITRAITALSKTNACPALYCSRLELVDEQLNPLGNTLIPRKIGFGNALVENIAVGCSTVINRKAIDLIVKNMPANVYMHDWWCYLVVACFGEVIFDAVPTIKYRQHANNSVGAPTGWLSSLRRKIKRFTKGRLWISEQIVVFLQIFADKIRPSDRLVLNQFLAARSLFCKRIPLALSKQIWRQRWFDNIILRFLILINRV
ncbi:MAG: glycosyltransferase family 2 protein [Methylococcales bacterium]